MFAIMRIHGEIRLVPIYGEGYILNIIKARNLVMLLSINGMVCGELVLEVDFMLDCPLEEIKSISEQGRGG